MTTKEYIKQIDFEYIETYSLLREEETEEYVEGLQKESDNASNDAERKELLSLMVRGTQQLLIKTGLPHPTAKKINVFKRNDSKVLELKEILSIEFEEEYDWMCFPVFREMVVFYDNRGAIISLLNICLSCERVEDENLNRIQTDAKIFDKFRNYFKTIGHEIEER